MATRMRHECRTVNGSNAAINVHPDAAILPHMSEPIDRVLARLKELNISPRDASLRITQGRNPDSLRAMKRGLSRYPKEPELTRLAHLLGVTAEWIVSGREENPDEHIRRVPIDDDGHPVDTPRVVSSAMRYRPHTPGGIPEIADVGGLGDGRMGDVFTLQSGGILSGHEVRAEWNIPQDITRHYLGADPAQVFIMAVDGDSMEPTLSSGDRVVVDPVHRTPRDGGIFVLDEGFGPMVKRCRLLAGTDPLEIEIISDNARLTPIRRPFDKVRVIGRVRGRWTRI